MTTVITRRALYHKPGLCAILPGPPGIEMARIYEDLIRISKLELASSNRYTSRQAK
jgi:hypothetical protein